MNHNQLEARTSNFSQNERFQSFAFNHWELLEVDYDCGKLRSHRRTKM